MGITAFLVLLAPLVWLLLKLRELQHRSDYSTHRIADLSLEIEAVRKAFHRRVSELEEQLAATKAQAAPVEPKTAGPAPPPVTEQPATQAPLASGEPAGGTDAAQPPRPAEPQPIWPDLPAAPRTPQPELPMGEPVGAGAATPHEQPSFESPPPRFPPPPAPWEKINWEQWIGVRGAALLGAVVLALAALLFLQYSIEHGLIPPIVRVAIGLLVGAGAIVGSEGLRRRGYNSTANALAGAGVVILYASVWAARALYDLIGSGFAYLLMILVTVSCALLSWRHAAREIAVLGLVGGFATPILLSTGSDNPIGLFAYVLMLDTGLLLLARKRRWPLLILLGLLGTLFYQFAWILGRMGPDRYWLGLLILGVFSAFFVVAGGWKLEPGDDAGEQRDNGRMTQLAGVLLPFAFALYFAGNADLGPHLYPAAILMALLCAAAGWLGRAQQFELLPLGASAGAFGVVLVWLLSTRFTTALAWEAFGICCGLALLFHGFVEWMRRDSGNASAPPGSAPARSATIATRPALVTALGFLLLLAVRPITESNATVWPWMCAWAVLAAVLLRQSELPGESFRQIAAAAGLGLGFALFFVSQRDSLGFPPLALFLGLGVAACAAFQIVALWRADPPMRWSADVAAAVAPILLLLVQPWAVQDALLPPWLYMTVTLVLALLAAQAATRLASGRLYFAVMFLLAGCHWIWTMFSASAWHDKGIAATALGLQMAGVVLFTFWPFLAGRRFLSRRWAIYAAALAGPAWFLSLRALYEALFGAGTIAVLPVVLGALSLGAVQCARKLGAAGGPATMRLLVWFSAVALSFIALAIPLQLDREWITLGWAVQGLAILALWKRLDHPGLKYFALGLLGVVAVRLILNGEVLEYHVRSGLPIVNWLMYTYLVPAAALLGSAYLLRELEIPRRRGWEAPVYAHGHPLGAIACGLAAILVVFVWINLTIFDFYSAGPRVEVSFERMAARDLTLSLAWAVYALVLLGIGFQRDAGALRWLSLAFLVLTIGKVFLHDLGELEDLYRVASLVGLALSLILVSLAYQRFVFRKGTSEGKQ
jgi:uncharacterized membrane protein